VLVADDHAATRTDIKRVLETDGRFVVCALACDAPEAVRCATRERPELCLVDIRMPGSGIAATWQITARLPATRVVMLTVSRDDRDLFAALRAGASGYLLKDQPAEQVPAALCAVSEGEVSMPGTLVARVVEEFRDRAPRRRALLHKASGPRLTSREWEVLDLMRARQTTGQIARRLFISDVTVRSHVASIMRKLRVPDREAAINMCPP
jgi:DNA-binding NarL/FixJ family response regulator